MTPPAPPAPLSHSSLDLDQIVGPTDGGIIIGRSAKCISDWRRAGLLVPTIATAGRFLYTVGDLIRVRDARTARRSPQHRARVARQRARQA